MITTIITPYRLIGTVYCVYDVGAYYLCLIGWYLFIIYYTSTSIYLFLCDHIHIRACLPGRILCIGLCALRRVSEVFAFFNFYELHTEGRALTHRM